MFISPNRKLTFRRSLALLAIYGSFVLLAFVNG